MRCPTCNSPESRLHPAVQVGGEVGVCRDAFHDEPRRDYNANEQHLIRQGHPERAKVEWHRRTGK